ncbi:MAG: hypothetical protein D6696_19900 [Acidobacteria bacterium]|nr:MAG: hypothetical protein D6696_19900 [Acidobacteriota bacterium]
MSDVHDSPRAVPEQPGDDGVVRLLRLAGRRPEVPARDAETVRAAAREEWRRLLRARRRRAWYWRGGGLLAAAALLALVLAPGLRRSPWWRSPATVASAEIVIGEVHYSSEHGGRELAPGASLEAGTTVETGAGDAPSRAALRLAGGTSLRLDAATRVRLSGRREVELAAGAIYVDSGPSPTDRAAPLAIHTPLGVVRETGTQFEVRYRPGAGVAMRVRVREGRVDLERDGRHHGAAAGVELRVQADGRVTTARAAPYGEAWRWVASVAPPLRGENPTILDGLRWAARESGWELRFADEAVAARAREGIMYGSVAGLSPEQAVALFLDAGKLGYRLEDGVLLVLPPAE